MFQHAVTMVIGVLWPICLLVDLVAFLSFLCLPIGSRRHSRYFFPMGQIRFLPSLTCNKNLVDVTPRVCNLCKMTLFDEGGGTRSGEMCFIFGWFGQQEKGQLHTTELSNPSAKAFIVISNILFGFGSKERHKHQMLILKL